MNSEAPVVSLASVVQRYGSIVAVAETDLTIEAASTTALIGPDGVGKSTLLALIAGAKQVQAGSVRVMGGEMNSRRHRRSVCHKIAYMPQGLGKNLYPTLSVVENADFFARLFGLSKAERRPRIHELLMATGLAPFADRLAGQLSGGMKQKLGLCCALIHAPELLILDEPTTGIDPLSRRHFWELITTFRIMRPEMTVLVATAYMEEADRFDQLVVMNAGRILATGSPQQIKAQANVATLEEAFISLLPPEKRGESMKVTLSVRPAHERVVAIEACHLTRRFGSFTAVDRVNFQIDRGEIFGFLGSNGCGKTTTMKMLTGLLAATEGSVSLFGRPLDSNDLAIRRRVGYMSQSFSLYHELTVRQNLELNANLFRLSASEVIRSVEKMLQQFGLGDVSQIRPDSLPLGLRQRLSLAVALVHGPEILILDEPTSGVDPVARDGFWQALIELSRRDGVTIFVSTHFMNEAMRCDRISLMHAGKVLATGSPSELIQAINASTLEDAFIRYLQEAGDIGEVSEIQQGLVSNPAACLIERIRQSGLSPERAEAPQAVSQASCVRSPDSEGRHTFRSGFSIRRFWAVSRREAIDLGRDMIRLCFTLFAPIVLMIAFSYGISFDVENLPYGVLDQDHTQESREYLDHFAHSRYFRELRQIADYAELERRLRSGQLSFAIEIPPDFGRDLLRGWKPQVGVWLDGAMPFRADMTRSYVEGAHQGYLNAMTRTDAGRWGQRPAVEMAVRYRYNQNYKSIYAIVPGMTMLLLMLIPAMMTAIGIVREKEIGSIVNLYVTPVTGLEYLLGKQLPYVAMALVNFASLLFLGIFVMGVPLKGSLLALALGAVLYAGAATAFGLLVSSFVRSQVAAVCAAGILSSLPAVQFSGLFVPVSTMPGSARLMSVLFPSTYFEQISIGCFTKSLSVYDLSTSFLGLAACSIAYLVLTRLLLRTQET